MDYYMFGEKLGKLIINIIIIFIWFKIGSWFWNKKKNKRKIKKKVKTNGN